MNQINTKIKTFRDLTVWRKTHRFVLEIYRITQEFPSEEKFGVTAQIRRAAVSIATNIVEGHKRNTIKDFLHFLNIADSSLEETKYLLLLSRDLTYLGDIVFDALSKVCNEIGRMLYALQKSLRS